MPFTRSPSQRGFTLLEIMIVIAIIAAVLAMASTKLFNTGTAMRAAVRKIAIMTREIRNTARLTGSTMRIAIKLDTTKTGQSFWIESAPGSVTLLSETQRKDMESKTRIQREDEEKKTEFSSDSRIMKKPDSLPRGMVFESVELSSRDQPITEGTAYIHFFPQGLAEEAAIHLTDRKTLNWTITINPLTGRADIYDHKISLKDTHNQ